MKIAELKEFLDEKVVLYNTTQFLEDDPLGIPHRFSKKEDIEIAAFLSATIAWGKRKSIIKNANSLLNRMEEEPYDFILNASHDELEKLKGFVHRTFNEIDARYFCLALRNLYKNYGGLEQSFTSDEKGAKNAIVSFRNRFLSWEEAGRSSKHISNPEKGSAAKRLNMFLRWMVRKDQCGVDLGIWNVLDSSELYCPLDVHSGNVARKLQLINRKANDWRALEELQQNLILLDPKDPVKYDFALFGLGVFENF